jgi:hypothetical protein
MGKNELATTQTSSLSRLREPEVLERIESRHRQAGRNPHQLVGPKFGSAAVVFAREGTASGHLRIYGKDRAQAHGQTNVQFRRQFAADNISVQDGFAPGGS